MTTQTKKLQYHAFFVGPKAEGFKVPCVPLDASNVLRAYVLAITPENVTREQVVDLVHKGDHKALKAADVVLKARIQRWFKGKENNEHDADGYIPSVGQNGNVVDIPLHSLEQANALLTALAGNELAKKGAALQDAIRKEAEADKRKCDSCGHVARSGQKFCPECGTKLPDEAPKEAAPKSDKWTCTCGHKDNNGKFCMECGSKRPETSGVGGTIPPKEETPASAAPKSKGTKKDKPATDTAPPLEDLKTALAALPESVRKSLGATLLRN